MLAARQQEGQGRARLDTDQSGVEFVGLKSHHKRLMTDQAGSKRHGVSGMG